MRSLIASIVGALALASLSSFAQAAPGAPVVTVGANLKQLQFDWEQVPTSNSYELWFKANAGAAWVKYSKIPAAQTARIRISVSVHLLDWRVAQYRVAACNPSGCTNSAEVGISGLALDAIGYFKPQGTGGGRFYGQSVALSADGRTFAVLSGDPVGAATGSVTVTIYRKTNSTDGWRREARLIPYPIQSNTAYRFQGSPLAISGDGNLVALGAPMEDGGPTVALTSIGAVYLFRFDGSAWTEEQRITGARIGATLFGDSVDLDDAGSTLVVMRYKDGTQQAIGTTDIYRHSSTGWSKTGTVSVDNAALQFCRGFALSGDGSTLVRTCNSSAHDGFVEVFDLVDGVATLQDDFYTNTHFDRAGIDVDYLGTRVAVRTLDTHVEVWQARSGAWYRDGDVSVGASPAARNDVALSRDGKLLVAGSNAQVSGIGLVYPPGTIVNGVASGSAYVFERNSRQWALRRILRPGNTASQFFGISVALGDNGRILAVGAPEEPSAAIGINDDPTDTSEPDRGAAWLY